MKYLQTLPSIRERAKKLFEVKENSNFIVNTGQELTNLVDFVLELIRRDCKMIWILLFT